MFTPAQKDALQEYMNIFTGHAASLLSQMVNKRIIFSISELKLIHVNQQSAQERESNYRDQRLPLMFQGHIVSSTIRFGRQFSGKAHLVFPVEDSKYLVQLCLPEDTDSELNIPGELTDTDYDAIREIGNVILNSIAGGFGNLLEVPLEIELPEVKVLASFNPMEEKEDLKSERYILIFFNSFSVQDSDVAGAVVVVLSIDSITMLLKKIDQVLLDCEE